jgi:hypothetical protein
LFLPVLKLTAQVNTPVEKESKVSIGLVQSANVSYRFTRSIAEFNWMKEGSDSIEKPLVCYSTALMFKFNLKNRLTSVKTNLPISLTTGLKLNDRVIIRDKRYIINEMKLDLTTGEANFTLLNDFAPLIPRAIFNGKQEGDDIIIPIVFPNGTSKPSKVIGAALRSDTADIIINPDSADEERSVIVTIPPVAEKGLFVDDEGDYIDTEEGLILRTEEGDARVIVIFIDYTFEDGTTTTQEKYIIQ